MTAGELAIKVRLTLLPPYDMEMTDGSPSGQMAFLDVIEKALT